jgi:hypothetical protein
MNGSKPAPANVTLLILGLFTLLFHFAVNGQYGFFRDELYYIACGEHLSFGYVDHPPMIALIAAVSRSLLGESLFAFRFLPAVVAAVLVVLAGLMARQMGGGRMAQAVAATAVLTSSFFLTAGSLFSTIVFDQLWWALIFFVLFLLLDTDDPRLFVAVGALAGLGLMTKHNMVFLGLGLAVGLLLTPERRHLRGPWLWLGGAIAAVIFLPHIIWQIQNDWPTLDFMAGLRRTVLAYSTITGNLVQIAMGMNPVSLAVGIVGICFLVGSPRAARYRLIGWIIVIVAFVSIVLKSKSYYIAPLLPPAVAAGGLVIERFLKERSKGWAVALVLVPMIVWAAVTAPLSMPILPLEGLLSYTEFLGKTEERNWTGGSQRLPTLFADMLGWPEMVDQVAEVFSGLPPDEQARITIYTSNFGQAGAIDLLGPQKGLPPAVCGGHSYFLWGPGDRAQDLLLTVGEPVDGLEPHCEEVELKAVHRHPLAMSLEQEVPIAVCRGLDPSLEERWPRLRSGY